MEVGEDGGAVGGGEGGGQEGGGARGDGAQDEGGVVRVFGGVEGAGC